MDIYIYIKSDTNIEELDPIINKIKTKTNQIRVIIENRRAFRNFEGLIEKISNKDVIIINDIKDIGNNKADIINRLNLIIKKNKMLVVNNVPSSYEYGIFQPINKAVLNTLIQTILTQNPKVIKLEKNSVGRNKISFPDNWDELYQKWETKQITSKEFFQKTGLKRATFYNLITEYKKIKQMNEEYLNKYKNA